jgi:CBS domain-containing protein
VIEPPEFAPEIFDLTMRGLEAGLRVGDIATFGVRTCEASASLEDVLADPQLKPFDAIPVRTADRVVGVVERLAVPTIGTVQDHMRRLDEDILVAADVPLKSFIPLLLKEPYRLVIRGARIQGIVTQSDVHKLPVRLLVFAHITHLEMTMAALIGREVTGDEWLDLLPRRRRDRVLGKLRLLQQRRLDPVLLELTDFGDKRRIVSERGLLGTGDDCARAEAELERIEQLRNVVAHAATFARTGDEFTDFVELLNLTETWISTLNRQARPLTEAT